MKRLIFLGLLLWSLANISIAQNGYIVVETNTGIESLHNSDELNLKSNELQTLVNSTGPQGFEVLGCDFFPVLAYVHPTEGFANLFDKALTDLKLAKQSFAMVTKEHQPDGRLFYRSYIKFPDLAPFNQLTAFEQQVINSLFEEAIKTKAAQNGNSTAENAEAEIAGLEKLIELFTQVIDGTLDLGANVMAAAGFEAVPVIAGSCFSRTGGTGTALPMGGNVVHDYTDMRVGNGPSPSTLYRDMVSIDPAQFSLTAMHAMTQAVVITDSQNTPAQLANAKEDFESAGKKIAVWMHFNPLDANGKIDTVYIKYDNNITIGEAETIIDELFVSIMAQWMPEITFTPGGGYSALRGKVEEVRRVMSCGNFSFKYGKDCLIGGGSVTSFVGGIGVGLLDGLLGTVETLYEGGKGIGEVVSGFWNWVTSYTQELYEHAINKGSMTAVLEKVIGDGAEAVDSALKSIVELYDAAKALTANFGTIVDGLIDGITAWLEELAAGSVNAGYDIGVLAFDLIVSAFTGGAYAGSSFLPKILGWVKKMKTGAKAMFDGMIQKVKNTAVAGGAYAKKFFKCKILGKGCFVKDTPVLMANSSFRKTAQTLALSATLPMVTVPIQEVQLLDYAVAHETINASNQLTASTNDIYFNGFEKDPYTSEQQKERDQFEIDDENWNEVVFEEVDGGSTAKLALHNNWISDKGYQVDAIVEMNLPEMGISGPFRITSIKHIIPQKKPVDDDEIDNYGYKPVTGLFIHAASDVWKIEFDNGEELGVTHRHPIFSTTRGDWQFAGELEIGEEVLTKDGSARVVTKEVGKAQEVYNLEVKDYHNFLVNASGIVAHNTPNCIPSSRKLLDELGISKALKNPGKHEINDGPNAAKIKEKFNKDPDKKMSVCYDDTGMPDFSEFIPEHDGKKISFEITNLTGHSSNDMVKARTKLKNEHGLDFGSNGAIEIPGYEGITWTFHHHQDGKTMQLVPFDINNKATHVGGATIIKKGGKGMYPNPAKISKRACD